MALKKGIYEHVINNELQNNIVLSTGEGLVCSTISMDAAEMPQILSKYVADIIKHRLQDDELTTEKQCEFVNNLLKLINTPNNEMLNNEQELLASVMSKAEDAVMKNTKAEVVRPLSGFRNSNLFTGGQSVVHLDEEIRRDILSSDSIYLIVSFLRMSGLNLIYQELEKFCSVPGHKLRVITTTYCGVTEAKAVERLSKLPNTEIRISYNCTIERLHAKAYIFERNSGLSSAYVGSSNLSKSAHTDGLEWNIRVTNMENAHIIRAARATFDKYWNSENFEDYTIGGVEKLRKELKIVRNNTPGAVQLQKLFILPHQKHILDRLAVERNENNVWRNLVVAATGTGKTVISAFDYDAFRRANPQKSRLLFVAHREEILKQSLLTFRSVLQDQNFGELWVGNHKPYDSLEYLFISVQTANSKIDELRQLGKDYYDYIVIDEAHHMTANSYRGIVEFFEPQILLGLTATPERTDGESLLPDFGGRISADIRLPKALEAGLLTPFQYYCVTDVVDLSDTSLWIGGVNGKFDTNRLSNKLCDAQRVVTVLSALNRYLPNEHECKALCFCCNKHHAQYMAQEFKGRKFRAESLTSDDSKDHRKLVNEQLRAGKLNYLFVVDIFNEGVDIPEVDTVLFLRPTESLTIFLQQLGRGLRLCAGKNYLTVLDFVAQINRNYDYQKRFRALLTDQTKDIKTQVTNGFTLLPHGCSIRMEKMARQYVLDSINSAIYNRPKLISILQQIDSCPSLTDFIAMIGQDIRLLYKNNLCWTLLKAEAGKCDKIDASDNMVKRLAKGMGNLLHINSVKMLNYINGFLQNDCVASMNNEDEHRYTTMLYYALFQDKISSKTEWSTVQEAFNLLRDYPLFLHEMSEIITYLRANLEVVTRPVGKDMPSTLELYGCYTREEIFTLFDRQTPTKKMQGSAAGVFEVKERNMEIHFVTLNKSDKDFSPTTQYEDYVISEHKFHWQTQNHMTHTNKGARYTQQAQNNMKFLLFVRQDKRDAFGNTSPYYCFGLLDYISSHGNAPMSIEWHVQEPIMPQFLSVV